MKNLLATLLFLSSTLLIQSNANAAFVGSSTGNAESKNAAYDEISNRVNFRAEGSKGGSDAYLTVVDVFPNAGTITFDWILNQNLNKTSIGYLVNGVETELAFSDVFNYRPSGSSSVLIDAGDTFGWFMKETGSVSSGALIGTISNISFVASPSAVPENNIVILMAAGLFGIAALRKKALV